MARPCTYLWQHASWPQLTYDTDRADPTIAAARQEDGRVSGQEPEASKD